MSESENTVHHIILVEDDPKLGQLLEQYFSSQGFTVTLEANGALAASLIQQQQPALVILDLMLPGKDGLTICREIRSQFTGKILFLTASDDDIDQVAALEIGADDFVVKPIQPRVLLARVRMLLRRTSSNTPDGKQRPLKELSFNALRLDILLKHCYLNEQRIDLTPGEFDLLLLLAEHAEQVLSREELVKKTRGIDYDGQDRTIDNKIASLRKKLGDNPSLPQKIITVRGKGYLFVPDNW
ncbi:response regulator [Pleionea sp. CnH1-48]|uniref:response regulator n=1 Tax=Pleionea sp. CnH1-48 TaxID=2954494 RepID=UPI0020979D98|nr:response regulator [Pleionea sp. CnH1-48]MCO7226728.1 response regulator [Pleionea sp. CnH1-48]